MRPLQRKDEQEMVDESGILIRDPHCLELISIMLWPGAIANLRG